MADLALLRKAATLRIAKAVNVIARTSVPEILFISTFILNRYLPNADFSYPYEILMPIVLFGVIITLVYYLYRLIFRRALTAHLASLPVAYELYHYDVVSRLGYDLFPRLLPNNLETPFTMALLILLGTMTVCGLGAWLLVKVASLPRLHASALIAQAGKVVLFIIGFNFLFQFVVFGNLLYQIWPELNYTYTPQVPTEAAKPGAKKPNIYYLVYDRYTNADVLKNIYNYDNSDMLKYLDDQDFVTRDGAYSNYPFTMSSIGSTLAMNYTPELAKFSNDSFQTGFPYRSILNNPPVVELLKTNGYKYNQVSSWWDFARIGVKADSEPTKSFRFRAFGHSYYQSDLARDIINRTILSPLLKKGVTIGDNTVIKYDLDYDPRQNFADQMSALRRIAQSSTATQPEFTMAHILVPHDPYVFNADGTRTPYSNDRNDDGADEYDKYKAQVTYVNSQIKTLVSDLKKNDPQAVIIIQSDEGPYPKEFRGNMSKSFYYDPVNLPVAQMQQKMGILASYYLPGVDKSIVAANMDSNVNTFRFILSHYMGYDLRPLPDCHISMGSKFQLFNFTLLNKQLTGVDADKECRKYVK